MMKGLIYIQLLIALLIPRPSVAESLVLIHGYLSQSSSWHERKTTLPLQQAGWKHGGNYTTTQWGISTPAISDLQAKDKQYFTVDLPADAPIEFQAGVLGLYLQHLYEYRKEPLVLVGHSAGGIVARAWLTMKSAKPTKALITIASPHLGTPLAEIASLGAKTPLNEMGRVLGLKNFRKSRAVFADLKEEERESGNYLYWLNRQTHPAISYTSIIRIETAGLNKFDYVVPRKSQDMNNVSAIRGHSAALLTKGDHFLTEQDGVYVRDLLKRIYQ